jgi:hypothetical protein
MKKLSYLLAGIVLATAFSAAAVVSGLPPLYRAGACASGFTRVAPNLCKRTDAISTASFPTSCTAVTLPATGAKELIYHIDAAVAAGNVAMTLRDVSVFWYSDAGCTVSPGRWRMWRLEDAALALHTNLAVVSQEYRIAVPSGGLWVRMTKNTASTNTDGAFQIRGYHD